jgi:EAL domain-containing protein (putative c-di-GMP-specific phosphodiesterase class I)
MNAMPPSHERRSPSDRRRTGPSRATQAMEAIDGGQVEILFQPQFACADDRVLGAEALARWQHPTRGTVGGDALFAVAEGTRAASALTRHVAQQALGRAVRWPSGMRLSLNVTAADLAQADFVETLDGLIAASGFEHDRLTVEITEQALVRDVERSAARLAALAERGVHVALDDFGAGFCNFRYLKLLPLHHLKLDRTMVDGIASCERDLAVLRAIVAMARALDIEVIAEGIESEDQLARIREEGCTAYQGFLRAEPMTSSAFVALAGA